MTTIGTDFKKISYELFNKTVVNINIFDTAGQERFRKVNKSYYGHVDACILVYDVTDRSSFKDCDYFISIIKEMCKKDIKLMLLGNKCDLENNRKVTK